jgi:hypothetical protein
VMPAACTGVPEVVGAHFPQLESVLLAGQKCVKRVL